MHIVIDARSRPDSTGRYVDRLLEHLQIIDTTNSYTILLRPDDDWEPKAKNFKGINITYKKFASNPLEHITFALFIRKLKPDLVHFAMTPQEPLFFFGKRVITTHDLTMFRFARPGRRSKLLHAIRMFVYRILFWTAHKKAKHIIVPTKYVKEDLVDLFPSTSKKTSVTYESSEPPIKGIPKSVEGVGKLFILHVGSPFPHKNIDRLVAAFEIMKQRHPNLQLVLAGKKEFYFEQLEKDIANSPVRDSVILPGFVSDSELKWLYQNAAAYVLPSESEGFGLPGLEAMAHNCPLVSSNATCLPEVYGNGALYFNPLDINAIANQTSKVISDHGLRLKLIENGQTQLQKYSWEKMAKQTKDIYDLFLS